jgi:hypothetical protein
MGTKRHIALHARSTAAPAALALLFGLTMAFAAVAQEPAVQPEKRGFFGTIGQWFEDQAANIGSGFKGARKQVEGFGHEAGIAAKTTAEGAKDAADAVARISGTRSVSGHETCRTAPNGAPDCVAAATALCKAKGFASGKSLDMTTAEVCPPKVYLSGRTSDAACKTETFVSRALCQ